MTTYKLRGKSIALPLASTEYLLSVEAPVLFLGYNTTYFNSGEGITQLYIESAEPYQIQLQDETLIEGEIEGLWTDPYSPPSNIFNMSGICLNDIKLIPSIDNQVFYVFASGS